MYLSRLRLKRNRLAIQWVSNPYRVHQRLMMACPADARLLFRIEEDASGVQILVQSFQAPDWSAFGDFDVLASVPESKVFEACLQAGQPYRFRLLANPAVKKTVEKDGKTAKTRLGLMREADQLAWLQRKLNAAGAGVLGCTAQAVGLVHSRKNPAKDPQTQVHFGVLYEGVLVAQEPALLSEALGAGIGPAKAYGFGLLSLAKA